MSDLIEWGLDKDELDLEAPGEHEIEEETLKDYKRSHVLLSFPPDRFLEVQPHIEALRKISGMEIEQASN